jgi:alpha-amylase
MATDVMVKEPTAKSKSAATEPKKYVGDGRDVLLQAFHWQSHEGAKGKDGQKRSWYRILCDNAAEIKNAGFTFVWFPPPSDSAAANGYIPRRWYKLDSAYGSESELREAIKAIEPVPPIADLVLNHRVGVATAGTDFEDPPFPDNARAVVCDDECGCGKGGHDTGEGFAAGRDLDHTNPEVRKTIVEYLNKLKAVGFKGWRYDLVKGFNGKFVGEYNDATSPAFSVGEFFDGDRQKVTTWIDVTGGKCGAFDFPTRFRLYEACTSDDYGGLRSDIDGKAAPSGLIGMWPSRSVTFVDSHDTEYRRANDHLGAEHFPDKTVAMGYAYILTHPGVPCVFWPHYFDWGGDTRAHIKQLIALRKNAGLHARSAAQIHEARHGLYAATIDGKVAVKLGADNWNPGAGWQLAVHGDRFAVWTRS